MRWSLLADSSRCRLQVARAGNSGKSDAADQPSLQSRGSKLPAGTFFLSYQNETTEDGDSGADVTAD
jgi:hypothetical protein